MKKLLFIFMIVISQLSYAIEIKNHWGMLSTKGNLYLIVKSENTVDHNYYPGLLTMEAYKCSPTAKITSDFASSSKDCKGIISSFYYLSKNFFKTRFKSITDFAFDRRNKNIIPFNESDIDSLVETRAYLESNEYFRGKYLELDKYKTELNDIINYEKNYGTPFPDQAKKNNLMMLISKIEKGQKLIANYSEKIYSHLISKEKIFGNTGNIFKQKDLGNDYYAYFLANEISNRENP